MRDRGKRNTSRMAGDDPVRRRNAKRSALTVFSVDTEDEARLALVTFGVHRYDGSYAWTGWERKLDTDDWRATGAALDGVTETLRAWYAKRQQQQQRGRDP